MKFRFLRKLTAFAAAVSVVAGMLTVPAAAEETQETASAETADYAEIVFDDEVKTTNIKTWGYISGAEIGEYGGEKAASITTGFWMDIDDQFMYNIPEGKQVWVTVKYFEETRKNLWLHYHAYGTNSIYDSGETVHRNKQAHIINADKDWKTTTFTLKDFKAGNGWQGNGDIAVLDWREMMGSGGLSGPLVIQSVRVEYRKYPTPLRVDSAAYFEKTGHIYSDQDQLPLQIPMKNDSADQKIKTRWNLNVYNENDFLIGTDTYEYELAPGEEKTEIANITNPKKKGVYYIMPESETATEQNGMYGEYVKDDAHKRVDFSISFLFKADELNFNVGVNNHNGDHEKMAQIESAIGIGWVREGSRFMSIDHVENGKYRMSEESMNIIRAYKNIGMKYMQESRPLWYEVNHWLNGPTWKQAYGAGGLPRDDKEAEEYAQITADFVDQAKGLIDNLEIFNEPDISDPNHVSTAQWKNIVDRVVEKCRKIDPDMDISGLAMTDLVLQKSFYENGGLENLDQNTQHRYDWSGVFDPWKFAYLEPRSFLDLQNQYKEMPMWMTEVGFISQDIHQPGNLHDKKAWSSVFPEGVPRHIHARNFTLCTAAFNGWGLYNKWFWHTATDFSDPTEREDCFGIFNTCYEDTDFIYTPYTAKPASIALAATNYFMRDDVESKNVYGTTEEGIWGFHFFEPKLNKDVFVLQAQYGVSGNKAFRLGCGSVDIYDIYGNHLGTMKSDDGVYSFEVTNEPYYIVGNFTAFEEAEKKPEISPEKITVDGIKGDIVTFSLKNNTGKTYRTFADGLEIVSNDGFVGDTAKISVKLPENDYGKYFCTLTVLDEQGNLVFFGPGETTIKDPLTVTLARTKLSENSDTRWGVLVTVRNNANAFSQSGTVYLTAPDYMVGAQNTRTFYDLAPQSSISYVFKFPEMVNKQFIGVTAEVKSDQEFIKDVSANMDFTTGKYAYQKPKIDGVQSPGEWTGSWFGVEQKEKIAVDSADMMAMWTGTDDLSFTGQIMWDEENFYFLGVVRDDVQYNVCQPGQLFYMWKGDGIQIGITDDEEINSVLSAKFTEIGLADEATEGPSTWCWNMRYEDARMAKSLEHDEHAIGHYDGYTVYEWKIPWSEMFYEDYKLDPSKKMRIAILINDSDGPGGIGNGRIAMEYGGGIAQTKDAVEFAKIEFTK